MSSFLVLKHYSGGKPKPEVDLEELKKLLDDFGKGDADAKIEKMDGDDDGNCKNQNFQFQVFAVEKLKIE